jgi:hypothetical protein
VSEHEAFGWAVRVVRLGDWSAAIPEQPKFEVAGQFLTIRDVCEREQNRDVPLPQAVADNAPTATTASRRAVMRTTSIVSGKGSHESDR